jgi:[ribosomal protein S5]-alanine N-acetyltransferase
VQRRPEVDQYGEAVEIAHSIVPDYRGQGFAFEATRALIDRALARHDICRITAASLDGNVISIKVLEKLGVRFVGASGEAAALLTQ